MPLRGAFAEASPSGCCFDKLCKFGADAAAPSMDACGSCGGAMHRLCAAENAWLKFCGGASGEGLKCFECSLLEALLVGAAHRDQLAAYYNQQADWSRTGAGDVTAFTIGAALVFNALSLQQVCKTTQRARLAPATGKCQTRASRAVRYWLAASVQPSSTTASSASATLCSHRRRWSSRPRSRGPARRASRRVLPQSSAPSSSRRASARRAPSASVGVGAGASERKQGWAKEWRLGSLREV